MVRGFLPVVLLMGACAPDVAPVPPNPTVELELPSAECLSVDAVAVAFVTSSGCASPSREVTVRNQCGRSLPVDVTASAPFTVTSGARAVPALGSARFVVQLGPTARGRQSGTLTFRSLAQELTLGLTADVEGPPLVEETLHLDAPSIDADVLLVLDDGASMAPIGAHVREQLDQLGQWLAHVGVVRFGVLNATRGTPRFAQLVKTSSGAPWLQFPGASAQAFSELTALVGTGDRGASCAEALLSAIDSGEYARFRRQAVPLQVLCVSNQADGMEQPFMPALDRLRVGLQRDYAWWPAATRVDVVSRFVPAEGACGVAGSLDNGRHLAVASTLNGRTEDVCAQWWPIYGGVSSFGAIRIVALSATPDFMRAPITVSVNGVELPENGAWRYDAVRNAVVLQFLDEVDLRITYATACSS